MSLSVVTGASGVPSFLAPTPAFSFFEQAISGQLVNIEIFDSLGSGWYQFKRAEIDFHVPGWLQGYDDGDVERPPVMVRANHYAVLGVGW
mgnify:CR=1 FL=1